MEIRLLGSVEVWAGGRQLTVASAQLRLALAALAVDAGRPVPVAALIDRVWGQHPPAAVRAGVHTRITHLRQLLATAAEADRATAAAAESAGAGGAGGLLLRPGGYVLQVDPDAVDLGRFRRLAAAAHRRERSDTERVALLDEALELWRGAPLAGLTGEWAARMRDSWRPERLEALLEWGRAALRLGQHARVIPALRGLTEDYPHSERLAVVLARALVTDGRRDEAAAYLRAACERLVSELGTDPGPELLAVQQAVLAGAPLPPLPVPRAPATPVAIPAQLPGDVLGFTGRTEHLARLDALLDRGTAQPPTTVVITAVSGTAGVGKTALAVHWAHRVAGRFPHGQLYVNLRGFDPGGQIMDPATAVRGFLDALGVPPERIPPDPDAQAALYRSVVAGKQVLVVLDNARDAEQVRSLLPGTGTAAVVVTSRNSLSGLVAVDGAHPLALDLLSTVEARELLAHRLGRDRVAAEPDAVDQVIAACARLPLALAVAAARVEQTTFPLATLAAQLADAGRRLDTLDAGDPASHVRTVFSWSYATLTAAAARLFRLLGLHPGPDISAPAAGSLGGLPPAQVRPLLTELVRAGLLGEQTPDRYAFHDLLRAYATHLVDTVDTDRERAEATVRLLDHYTHTAHTADRHIDRARDPMPIPLTPSAAGTTPEELADPELALGWLSAERPVLLAIQRLAADAGRDLHAWQLAWALHSVLDRQGRWLELIGTWQTALPAADRLPHPAGASAHRVLGAAVTRLADHEPAQFHLQHALDLYTEAADPAGQAYAHIDLTMLWDRREQPDRALGHAQQALALYRAAGHRRGETDALNAVGWCYTMLGEPLQALTYCQQALTLYQQLGDRVGEAAVWDSLGYAHHHLNQHAEAADCYQRALTLIRDLGDRYYEAIILTHLGDTQHAAGQPEAARTAWTTALDILTDLDHPEADDVRAKLADLG